MNAILCCLDLPTASKNPLTFDTAISCLASSEDSNSSFLSFCHFRSIPRFNPYATFSLVAGRDRPFVEGRDGDPCDLSIGEKEPCVKVSGLPRVGLSEELVL